MAEIVGRTHTQINDIISGDFVPEILTTDFQAECKQLHNAEHSVIVANLQAAVYEFEYQIRSIINAVETYEQWVNSHIMSKQQVERHIKTAVFNFALAHIIALDISTLDTKDASGRHDNLLAKQNTHEVEARRVISMLLGDESIGVAVV